MIKARQRITPGWLQDLRYDLALASSLVLVNLQTKIASLATRARLVLVNAALVLLILVAVPGLIALVLWDHLESSRSRQSNDKRSIELPQSYEDTYDQYTNELF